MQSIGDFLTLDSRFRKSFVVRSCKRPDYLCHHKRVRITDVHTFRHSGPQSKRDRLSFVWDRCRYGVLRMSCHMALKRGDKCYAAPNDIFKSTIIKLGSYLRYRNQASYVYVF